MMLWLKIAIALLCLFFFMLGLLCLLGYIAEVREARK